jgi:hypothetical protein
MHSIEAKKKHSMDLQRYSYVYIRTCILYPFVVWTKFSKIVVVIFTPSCPFVVAQFKDAVLPQSFGDIAVELCGDIAQRVGDIAVRIVNLQTLMGHTMKAMGIALQNCCCFPWLPPDHP